MVALWCLMVDGCFVADDGNGRSMVFDSRWLLLMKAMVARYGV